MSRPAGARALGRRSPGRAGGLAALALLTLAGCWPRRTTTPGGLPGTPLALLVHVPMLHPSGAGIERLCAVDITRVIASPAVTQALDHDNRWLRREITALSADFGLDLLGDIDQVVVAWYPEQRGKIPFVLAARGRFDPSKLSARVLRSGGRRVRFGVQLDTGQVMLMPDTGLVLAASGDLMMQLYARIDRRVASAEGMPELRALLGELGSEHGALFFQRFPDQGWDPPQELGALARARRTAFVFDFEEGLRVDGLVDFLPGKAGSSPAGAAATALRKELARLAEHPLAAIAGAVRYLEAAAFEGTREQLRVAYRLPMVDINVLVSQLMAGARLFRRVAPTADDVVRVGDGPVDEGIIVDDDDGRGTHETP